MIRRLVVLQFLGDRWGEICRRRSACVNKIETKSSKIPFVLNYVCEKINKKKTLPITNEK